MNRSLRFVLLIALALVVFVLPTLSGMVIDLWWFQEIGHEVVFTRTLATKLALFVGTAVVAWLVIGGNLRYAQRGVTPGPIRFVMGGAEQSVHLSGILARFTRPVTIVLSLLLALGATGLWDVLLFARYALPFGEADPILGRDIGWHVFTLPALAGFLTLLRGLLTFSLAVIVPVYVVRGDIAVLPGRLRIATAAGRQLGLLVAAWLVLIAVTLWYVDSAALLSSTTGPLVGASYTDVHAMLPALRASAIAALLGAGLVLVGAQRGQLGWYGFLAVGGYAVVSLVGRGVLPAMMQKFVVAPTELTRETPYLAHHIAATRRAWSLDSVEVRELSGETRLTRERLAEHGPTLDNVRLWDREPLLRTFKQLQEIRTYYDFVSVDDDRYWIDGKYRQVLFAARELNASSLPTRTFINEHLTFTHGMGLTMSPVNEVTTEGLPVLFVQDLPPRTTGSLQVSRPQLYYGELTGSYAVVNTRQQEFDYPSGDTNVFRAYTGTGGVRVGGLVRRALFAAHFGALNLLLSGDISSESRIMYGRNIGTRVRKTLPFLSFDRDPYLVVMNDGTLQWVQDAFTTSTRYPYSFRTDDGTSYMRNSVKVVIDAYNGSIRAYVALPHDPIIQVWDRIFPGILQPLSAMPADLAAHLRYPDDLFRLQTSLYTTYHMDTPAAFYNREDQWQIPMVERADGSVPFMRHIVMRLPDEPTAEFIYMAPFTPRGKDNLAAWMVARNDGEHYGRLLVYRFPRQSLVFGPRQIENRISQDTEISRQISLWDQRGSQVIKGDLLVIPIESELLYVQPLYLQAEGGRIPELKRVVIAYQNQVVMAETFDAALVSLFGGAGEARARGAALPSAAALTSGEGASPELQSLISEARRRYQAAVAAQRDGDWTRYGEEIRQLGILLERLGTLRGG